MKATLINDKRERGKNGDELGLNRVIYIIRCLFLGAGVWYE